jgi:hypothetical protein
MAAWMLSAVGFDVLRSGTLLTVSGHQVVVEAACNGIRYLYALLCVLIFGYITRSQWWIRAALCLAAFAASPLLAEGHRHTWWGW